MGLGLVEESDKSEKREKKNKKQKEKAKGLLNLLEAEDMREDNGEKSNEDDMKMKKKKKREKKMGDSYLQDRDVSGEELSGKNDQMTKKHKKKHVKELEGDSEVISAKEDKKRKKEKRDKVMEDGGSYDRIKETLTRNSHVEGLTNKETLDLSKVEGKPDHDIDLEDAKGKKKEKKCKHKEGLIDSLSKIQNCKHTGNNMEPEPESIEEQDNSVETEVGEGYTRDMVKKKSKKKKEKIDGNVDSLLPAESGENSTKDRKRKNITRDEEERNTVDHIEGCNKSDTKCSKKRKKDKKRKNITGDEEERNTLAYVEGSNNVDTMSSKKKKKNKCKNVTEDNSREILETPVNTRNTETKKSSKRVKFSGKVEVFPLNDAGDVRKKNQEGKLVRGKRFSKEEDELVKNAVFDYIKEHGLGDDGLHKVLHCSSYPEIKSCWKVISAAIPWRPAGGIYSRAHILFERAENQAWTDEDLEFIREFHEKHGPDWKALAEEMKRSRLHVKDTWRRRVSLPNKKRGNWSQEEYQTLFDLVNMDLRMKVFEEKRSQHGMLRDNIAWDAISKKLSTRSNDVCCSKWYGQLESPLVRDGKWASSDDFRLLRELFDKDHSSVEEVDWDSLLDHRPGDICRKRWYQMVNHLGDHGNKAFADQLEVLMQRYCPELLETREVLESKIPVDVDVD